MRRALITGGAGFIGSSLADQLATDEVEVVVYDNFRTGRHEFLADLLHHDHAELVEGDLLDTDALTAAMKGCDTVFHFAANADVRHGLDNPQRDLEQNTVGTANVLEAMRANGTKKIAFSSTGSVYGEPDVFPTPEDCPFPVQTSLYAASKLAGESMIQAYCHGYQFTGLIFRFVSILGERYTHGHVFDFYQSLREDPTRLRVLGDGKQEKSYLYIGDCISAIQTAMAAHNEPGESAVYNLGTDETLVVDDSVAHITKQMGIDPAIEHTGGKRGWAGDSPFILLDCTKIRSLGWSPELTIPQAIERTVAWFDANPSVFDANSSAVGQ